MNINLEVPGLGFTVPLFLRSFIPPFLRYFVGSTIPQPSGSTQLIRLPLDFVDVRELVVSKWRPIIHNPSPPTPPGFTSLGHAQRDGTSRCHGAARRGVPNIYLSFFPTKIETLHFTFPQNILTLHSITNLDFSISFSKGENRIVRRLCYLRSILATGNKWRGILRLRQRNLVKNRKALHNDDSEKGTEFPFRWLHETLRSMTVPEADVGQGPHLKRIYASHGTLRISYTEYFPRPITHEQAI